jgi:radical SAM protein with 4Fe4S-binding SPASM domain
MPDIVRPPPWWRPAPFGAWVRFGDATLAAIDHALRARLGLDPLRPHVEPEPPLEVHAAVTQRCSVGCAHCYQGASPDGCQPAWTILERRLDAIAALGASTVALGGGEPLERDDLPRIAAVVRARGMVPVMTTNGHAMTPSRARSLRGFAQVNVSHDGVGGAYARARGHDHAALAERAIAMLSEAGVAVGINMVLTADTWEAVEPTVERAVTLGAREVQLLRFKPGGRASAAAYARHAPRPEQVLTFPPLLHTLVRRFAVSVRIDCALVPLLHDAVAEHADAVRRLDQFGVFGCEAGRYLATVRIDGRIAPCSFWPEAVRDIASGLEGWRDDPELSAIRAYHADLPDPCRACAMAEVCRGGCQVVARHVLGRFAPDPGCPRVQRHAARGGAISTS